MNRRELLELQYRDRQAVAQAHEELEQMLNVLSNSFTNVRELLERSGNPRRNDLTRRIQEVNLEFTRIRANGMRESFEQNLRRQQEDRLARRENDSDSSSDSDNSDIDLDFSYPVDLWDISTTPSASNDSSNETTVNTETSASLENIALSNQTENIPTPSTASMTTNSNGSSSLPSDEQPTGVKRKRTFETEAPSSPPAKRSMATSTDDAYFAQR